MLKHRTPKADVASLKPHQELVGDLVPHLIIAKQGNSGGNKTF